MTDAPTTVGPYTLDRELGRGAFGSVWLAFHHDRPDHPVALKLVEARGDAQRALLEPAFLAQLEHPHVVRVEDYFLDGSKLAIAMEYVAGEDLKTCLDRGDTFSVANVRALLAQVGGALAAAHARQIVHRDLKPANILLDTSGGTPRFVLTDFGIGRRHEGIQSEKHAGGTYHFMAPEQLRGRPGPQSDLWALGVVAYRMLTGRLPFPGPSLGELSRQIQYAAPPPPSEVAGRPIPADLEAVVLKLLDRSLNERTPSAEQLLRDLGVSADSKVTPAVKAEQVEPLRRRLERTVRGRTGLLGVCLAVLFLMGGVAVGLLSVAGMVMFFVGQSTERDRRRRWGSTTAAFLVFLAAIAWRQFRLPDWPPVAELSDRVSAAAKAGAKVPPYIYALWASIFVGGIVLPAIGCAIYASLRRVQRDVALLDVATSGGGAADFLPAMRTMVDRRLEDVGFHLRYAELLFARGDYRGAAVEARLLLEQDEYHFNGNLLLANAYAALGLRDDCRRVCDDYLAVAGYCFEFAELRQQCGGPAA